MPLTEHFATYEEADTVIRKLERELSLMRGRRNALSTINRLPPETLSTIFLALASAHATMKKSKDMDRACYGWLVIISVCRHWKEVATSTPRLWADIYFRDLSWKDDNFQSRIQLFFERSGRVPLRIIQRGGLLTPYADVSEKPLPPHLLKLLLGEFRRLSELSIAVEARTFKSLSSAEQLDSPILQSLAVSQCYPQPSEDDDDDDDDDDIDIPLVPFSQASWPKLTTLRCCWIQRGFLEALTKPSLTSLEVIQVLGGRFSRDWLAVLKDLPRLRTLRLEHYAQPVYDVDLEALRLPEVHLPRLTDVYLVDACAGAVSAELLDRIILPPTAHITLDMCHSVDFNASQFVFEAFAGKALGKNTAGSPTPATRLAVSFPPPDCRRHSTRKILDISTSTASTLTPSHTAPQFTIQFDIHFQGTLAPVPPLFNRFLATHPLSHVTTLSLRGIWGEALMDGTSWRLLSSLPAVQDLRLRLLKTDTLPAAIRRALQGHPSHDAHNEEGSEGERVDGNGGDTAPAVVQDSQSPTVPFPKLTRLLISGFVCEPTYDPFLKDVADVAHARRQMGVPLKHLKLTAWENAGPAFAFNTGNFARMNEAVDEFQFWWKNVCMTQERSTA